MRVLKSYEFEGGEATLQWACDELDDDGDEMLTVQELKGYLCSTGEPLTREEFETLIQIV